jgi:GNAT superfamily N-acetyltransferase
MQIREGKREDLPQVLELIKELALYEKAPHEVDNTEERMLEDGFGDKPVFEFFVAEADNKIVGIAIYFYSYSTWKGKCIYLEDLIVTESYRGKGLGKALFDKVVEKAKEVDARRVSWQVLDWNEPAINFYKSLDAVLDPEWINCKLTKEQIKKY